MSDILAGLPGVIVYIDDILVFGKDMQEHYERLKKVLERLESANLQLNWSKCQVRKNKVKYLGHWFSADGVSPDEGKLQLIAEMPLPQCLADVQRFLGMATYLAKLIPQLS